MPGHRTPWRHRRREKHRSRDIRATLALSQLTPTASQKGSFASRKSVPKSSRSSARAFSERTARYPGRRWRRPSSTTRRSSRGLTLSCIQRSSPSPGASSRRRGSERDCPAAVLDAPLIVEAGLEGMCDCLVFVSASEESRSQRIAASRGWNPDEIGRREKFQESLTLKRERADYIIDNDGSLDETLKQAVSIWGKIVKARPRSAKCRRGQSGLS